MSLEFFKPNLLTSVKRAYNNDTGASFVVEYKGTQVQMEEIAAYYEAGGAGAPLGYGYKTQLIRSAGVPVGLVVVIPDEILYTERWKRSTEQISTSIWNSMWCKQFLGFTSTDPTTNAALHDTYNRRVGFLQKGISNRRQGLDANKVFAGSDAVTAGGPLEFTDDEVRIINICMTYGESFTIKRPILTRQRWVPYASDQRASLFGLETVYTTQELIDAFDVPTDIAALIATVEDGQIAAAPDTLWGWKSRCDDAETIINSGKWSEALDFVYDRWPVPPNKRFEF